MSCDGKNSISLVHRLIDRSQNVKNSNRREMAGMQRANESIGITVSANQLWKRVAASSGRYDVEMYNELHVERLYIQQTF